ncbi:hypothetical protein DICPUDRAFT_14919, partial [Dictyostelium purpureum]
MNNEKHNYSLGVHIYKEKNKRRRRFFGLKQKVALKEAIGCMLMSGFVLFVKIGSINVNLLILVPVVYVMMAFNISSLAALLSGSVVVWGLGIAALYTFILQKIVDASYLWVSYIFNFFFTFILYSLIPGRRWINLFAAKMMLINLICCVYFNQGLSPYEMIWQFLVLFCLVFCVLIFCGMFLFPWLASRLFLKKVIKTFDRTKNFFRAVGYQMEAKLDMEMSIGKISPTTPQKKRPKSFMHPIYSPEYMSGADGGKVDDHISLENQNGNDDINLESIATGNENVIVEQEGANGYVNNKNNSNSNNNINNNNDNNINSNNNIPHSHNTSHNKQTPIVTSAIKIPSKEDLLKMEGKLNDQIFRLSIILAESRMERWNAPLIAQYEQLLALLEMSQKQLITIKQSIDEGFEIKTRQEMILPMIPFIDSIIEEVHLQNCLFIDILKSPEKYDYEKAGEVTSKTIIGKDVDINSIHYKRKVLEMSFEETQELINSSKIFYKSCVKEYQRGDNLMFHESEISKVHFFLIGIFSFASSQKRISDIVLKVKKLQRYEPIIVELLRYGVWFIITSFPLHIYKRVIKVKNIIQKEKEERQKWKQNKASCFVDESMVPYSAWKRFWKFTLNWFWATFFANKRWVFPLQVAIGFTSTIIIFHYFDGKRYHELEVHGMWTCITTVIVFSPSLGATSTRSIHRMIGTIGGGFLGFLVSWLTSVVHNEGREVLLFIFTFFWIFAISHIQQDPRYSYAGSVSGLTFIMVSYGQYLSHDYTVMYAVMRCLFITMGIVWVLVLSLVIFPFFTYKSNIERAFKNASNITNTFIKILENSSFRLSQHQENDNNSVDMEGLVIHDSPKSSNEVALEDKSPILNSSQPQPVSPPPEPQPNNNNADVSLQKPIHNNTLTSSNSNNIKNSSNVAIEPPKVTPEQYKAEMVATLRGIRVTNGQFFAALVDVKSELFFKPHRFKYFFKMYGHLSNSNTRLVMAETILSKKLSDTVLDEMVNAYTSINQIITDLKKVDDNYNAILADKPLPHDIEANDLNDRIQNLIDVVHQIRLNLLERKIVYELYPDMIQFGASIFIIHDFVRYQITVYNHLLKLKSNK